MKPIKNAIIYKAALPSVTALNDHLASKTFTSIGSFDFLSAGFEPVIDDRLAMPFPGGVAFKLRLDEKIIPASVTTEKAKERIAQIEEEQDRRLPKNERQAIRDEVYNNMLPIALVKTQRVICFYHYDTGTLLVPTSNNKLACRVTSLLVKAVGSIKTETIHVSDIKSGLTAKLNDYLDGVYSAFNQFDAGSKVKLKGEDGKSMSLKLDEITEAKLGIIEAIESDARVVELELNTDDVEFRINADFHLKGISFIADAEVEEFDSEIDQFQHEASVQTLMLVDVVKKLCNVFEYKESESSGQE